MTKTITLGNWKVKDTKESLVEAKEVWFFKDLKTNKYYSLLGMDPNDFNKKDINHVLSSHYGKSFCGYPLADENLIDNNSDYSNDQKKIKFKRQFKIVSIFDYIKDIKKGVK